MNHDISQVSWLAELGPKKGVCVYMHDCMKKGSSARSATNCSEMSQLTSRIYCKIDGMSDKS
jgi:hypothetical protein